MLPKRYPGNEDNDMSSGNRDPWYAYNDAQAERMYTQAELDAAVAAERERCAKPVPDEWLVKVRRLVQGFEHVSGIARLWEPDYSSGSERALWSRATEACADVAKLLRDAEGPNAELTGRPEAKP